MTWTGDPSHLELIIRNIVATLEAVKEADGYQLTVEQVTREVRDIENEIIGEVPVESTPLHQIVFNSEETSSAASSGLVRASASITDWLVVAYEDVQRAIADTKRAMWADRRRGTHPTTGAALANDTRIPTIETAEGILYPYELVRIEFEIDYVHLEGAP